MAKLIWEFKLFSAMKTKYMHVALLLVATLLMFSCKVPKRTIQLLEYEDPDLFTEWIDGKYWVYKNDSSSVVGMAIYFDSDDYGDYYQINLFVMNLSDHSIIFDPYDISARLASGSDTNSRNAYTLGEYMNKINKKQRRDNILYGISSGLNAAAAGYSTTYSNGYAYTTYNPSVYALAGMVASSQLRSMNRDIEYDKKIKQVGYIKKNTIYPGEGLNGYMNIERKKSDIGVLCIEIPVGGETYMFQWYIGKSDK